ncbi:hypothetical protein OSB04_007504 [Centaurea solstitialis]|uniref:PB1 domain-containing protein n=1 Tax=Centaurea solstitialis TaxID=347529 RepID=A0AA38TLP9_9ASTR|nr:hypothetical protein OSB04_007504 [Centaurea solstitialis]
MDPPPTTVTATAVAVAVEPHSHSHTHSHSLPPLPTSKIRLMCSYGGHIVPRPQTKSLCYAGGDTRIVAVDRRTTAATIAALTHHLSRTLYGNRPFALKYQLPNEDLDALISITTDEDLSNMIEEHDRIAASPTPARIRLFLFSTRPESVGSLLLDPKSESWFSDALKGTIIINRGLSDGSGMGNGLVGMDCLEGNNNGGENSSGDSGKESMVLDTCSSFGSINSSVSASNLAPIGVSNEDGSSNFKVKLGAPGSTESEGYVKKSTEKVKKKDTDAVMLYTKYQQVMSRTQQKKSKKSNQKMKEINFVERNQLCCFCLVARKLTLKKSKQKERNRKFQNINRTRGKKLLACCYRASIAASIGLVATLIENDNSAASAFPNLKPWMYQDQVLHESESIIYHPSSTIQLQKTFQVSGYPMPHISDHRQHLPIQYIRTGSPQYIQYPTGPLPISSYYPMYVPYQQRPPNQPYPIYVMPVGPTDQSYNIPAPSDMNGSLGRPPSPVNSHVAYKEATVSLSVPEQAAAAAPVTPSNRVVTLVQPVDPTTTTTPAYENEYDNDLAYAQIYKSQPSAPAFPPPKYETVAKTGVELSDPSTPVQITMPQQ